MEQYTVCAYAAVRDLSVVCCQAGSVLATTTDAVAAWSTFAAVLVALGLSLVPAWWRWYKRPRLEWSVGRNEPYRMVEWGEGLISGAEFRILVGNKPGHRQAENVRAQLRTVWFNKPQENKPWGNLEIDITALRWVSRRDEVTSAQQITVIPAGGIDFVTYAHWDRQRHSIVIPHARKQDANTMQSFGPGAFIFNVLITADGVEPVSVYITVSTDPGRLTVERSKRPGPTEVYSVGIYKTLDPETPSS